MQSSFAVELNTVAAIWLTGQVLFLRKAGAQRHSSSWMQRKTMTGIVSLGRANYKGTLCHCTVREKPEDNAFLRIFPVQKAGSMRRAAAPSAPP